MKHLLDIKPDGGTYIYSACEAFSEEMEIDFVRLWHWLERFNIDPVGFSVEKMDGGEYKPCFDKRFRASGHASREDITWAIEQIDPDYVVPIRRGIGLPRALRMWSWWMKDSHTSSKIFQLHLQSL
jgi:ribonuclease J